MSSPMEFPQLGNDEFPKWGNEEAPHWENEEFSQCETQKILQISPGSETLPRTGFASFESFCRS